MPQVSDSRDLKELAAKQATRGNWKAARGLYLSLEKAEPKEGSWPRRAGEMSRRLNQPAEAVADLARAVDVYSNAGFLLKAVAVNKVILELDAQRSAALQAKLAALHSTRSASTGAAGSPAAVWPTQLAAGPALADVSLGVLVAGARPSRQVPAGNAALEIPLGVDAATARTARRALALTPVFSSLAEPQLLLLIEHTRLRRLARDEVLFRIGDPPNGLYVVASGEVSVASASEGREVEIARLREGTFFGERALLTNQPRTFTVRATVDSELLVIDRAAVGALMAESPAVLLVLLRFMRDRLLTTIVETNRLFAPLPRADRRAVASGFHFLEVEAGAALVEQGQRAGGLFIILCGEVEVLQAGVSTARLGPGKSFGETSLLTRAPAASTFRALKKCFLLVLPAAAFEQLAKVHPHLAGLLPAGAEAG